MNALSESTIPLTEGETEFLKRVLREAKEQAAQGLPKTEDGISLTSKSSETEFKTPPGNDTSLDTTTFIL